MTMTFANRVAVDLMSQRAGLDGNCLAAQTQRAAQITLFVSLFNLAGLIRPLRDQRNHRMRSIQIKFGGVGAAESANMTRKFDHSRLHAKADAQERDLVDSGKLNRLDHTFRATLAETARNQNGVKALEHIAAVLFDFFGVNQVDLNLVFRLNASVDQRFVQALIAVGVINVLADHADRHLTLGFANAANDFLPLGQIGRLAVDIEALADNFIKVLSVQHQGHFVNRACVGNADDMIHRHVAKECDLGTFTFGNFAFGTAQKNVRIDTLFA